MRMTMFTADCSGRASNCIYPNRRELSTPDGLRDAVRFDHVCGEFRNCYRALDNFIRSDVIVMDIDNDHSEDEAEWITPDRLDELMSDVSYAVAFSRNHMRVKGGMAARPKMHVYLPIAETTDAERYVALKRGIRKRFDFFDGNALDAARFIFGARSETVIWHEGWLTIDEVIEPVYEDAARDMGDSGVIMQGSRNSTMSRFASRVLKRYGMTEKAHVVFLDHAKRCDPPLPERELAVIWDSAVRFFQRAISESEGYVPADEYENDFESCSLKPEDFSDIGQARVLVREYGGELRYSAATDFLRFDGRRWVEDVQLAIGAVEEFMDLQLEDARQELETAERALADAGVPEAVIRAGSKAVAKVLSDAGDPLLSALTAAECYRKFVIKRRDYKYLVSTANAAKPMLGVSVNELDAHEFLINTPGGTYDLRRGAEGWRPHDSGDLLTMMTACSPGPEGERLWLDALELFFCGDAELISYVQAVVGMAAIGRVYWEHMIIAYGGGANGKSTFWNTIFRVLGDYAGKLSAEALTMSCRRNVKPEVAELKGRRLILASEMDEGVRLNTAVVKQLCSTDEIQAEKKYKDPFSFKPSHTLVLYTNHLPRVGANDAGIWRRLIVLPFNAVITGSADVKNYAEFLFRNAGGFIMSWILEGARQACEADFKVRVPRAVAAAVEAYREDNDWMGHFLSDCCELGGGFSEKSGELYRSYRLYCARTGEFTRGTADFYAAVDKAGFVRRKQAAGSFVFGLRLKEEPVFPE